MVRRNYCAGADVSVILKGLNNGAVRARQAQGSCVTDELIDAYLRAQYWVQDSTPFCLEVGKSSDELRQIYWRYSVDCAAFITAFNPKGLQSNVAQNRARHTRLQDRIQNKGLMVLLAKGCDSNGMWPAEESVLVPGLRLAEASEIGRYFQQNAIVWCGPDAVPQLVLLR